MLRAGEAGQLAHPYTLAQELEHVHFDMEQYAYKDLLSILKQLLMEDEFRDRTDVGITIQAYLRDSEQDVRDLIAWVKQRGYPNGAFGQGAYWDQETIKAVQKDWPSQFSTTKLPLMPETITELLLENHEYLYSAMAS